MCMTFFRDGPSCLFFLKEQTKNMESKDAIKKQTKKLIKFVPTDFTK